MALLDQSARVGGAYWRHNPDHLDDLADVPLHHDWTTFRRLHTRLQTVDVMTEHTVWSLERRGARLPGAGAAR